MCIPFLPFDRCYMILHIYIVLTYFASFTGYEDDIFEVIPNLHFQGTKHSGKFDKFCGKSLQKKFTP